MSEPCCGSDRKTALLISVSALLAIAVIGWGREANKPPRIVEQPIEIDVVEVLVAAEDLATGTTFTKANVSELTQLKHVPVASVPAANFTKSRDELVGKRLQRAARNGELIPVADLSARTTLLFEPGKDIMWFPIPNAANWNAGDRFDVVVSPKGNVNDEQFTLVPDRTVFAVTGRSDIVRPGEPFEVGVNFQLSEQQTKLIAFATQLDCKVELRRRNPFDYEKSLAQLKAWKQFQASRKPEVAPAPRAVGGS